jgi:hypothetical protein
MAAGNPRNIISQPAWLWYAPLGEANPNPNSIGVGDDWGGNWEWVGLTTEPLVETDEVTEFEIEVQQIPAAVLSEITAEDKTLTTTLAEQTATLIQLLEGGNITITPAAGAQVGMEEVKTGGRTARTRYKVGFETIAVDDDGNRLPLRVFYHIATFGKGGGTSYGKGAVAGMPVSIRVYPDTTQAATEQIKHWQRVTAPFTS